MIDLDEVALVDPEDIELIQGMVQPRVCSEWLDVAGLPVPPNSKLPVRDTAWLVLDQMKQSTTTFKAMTDWLRMMAHTGTLCKPNGPHEPNKFPPSLDVCRFKLEVPDLALALASNARHAQAVWCHRTASTQHWSKSCIVFLNLAKHRLAQGTNNHTATS
jgi:hypothetical protein